MGTPIAVNAFRLARWLGGVVVVVGVAVLVGWAADLPFVCSLLPNAQQMVPNTALSLMLLGTALIAAAHPAETRTRRWLRIVLSCVTAAIAAATLAEYALARDLGIDRVLFDVTPARPARPTAVALLLLSVALVLRDLRIRWLSVAELMAAGAGLIVVVVGVVYLHDYRFDVATAPFVSEMAVPTALAILALTVGVLIVRPEQGVAAILTRPSPGGAFARRFLLITTVPLVVLGVLTGRLADAGVLPSAAGDIATTVGVAVIGLTALIAIAASIDAQEAARTRMVALVDATTDAVITSDPDGVVTSWNPGATRVFGYTAEEMIGRRLATLAPPQHTDAQSSVLGRVRAGEVVPQYEAERRHRDGHVVDVSISIAPVRAPDGRVVELAAIIRDVSERRAAERELARTRLALERERARLDAILTQLPEGLVVVDTARNVVRDNVAVRRLARGTGERGVAFSLDHVRTPAGAPLTDDEQPVARALAGETVTGLELAVRADDGTLAPVLASATPVRHDGDVIGAVAVLRDIRAIKDLERLREEWTSVVAHDLRQPINALRLSAELLLQGGLPPRLHGWAERVRTEVLRMNAMIDDLLDASRLESQRMTLRPEPVDVAPAVRDAIARVPGAAARCDVTIDAPSVRADPVRLVQILANLIANALKYGTPGTRIAVDAHADGLGVRVTVTNHGPGIPADELPKVFGRFHRTTDAASSGVEGLGLGLYISKGLVEAHGGRIWAESTPGATTRFHVVLPAAAAPVVAAREVQRIVP